MNSKAVVVVSIITLALGFFFLLWLFHEEVKGHQNPLIDSEKWREEEDKNDWDA